MKNKISSVLMILCLSGIIYGCEEQTKESKEPQKQAEPLVIENAEWNPHGVFNGTIILDGAEMEGRSYEGTMYIEMDGDKVRISCTNAVENDYGDIF